jgi:hypothetical protein
VSRISGGSSHSTGAASFFRLAHRVSCYTHFFGGPRGVTLIKHTKRIGSGHRNMINYQRRILSHIAVTRPQKSAA